MPNKDIAKTALVRKQKSPWLFIAIAVIIVIAISFSAFKIIKKVDYVDYKNVKIGNQTFKLEVADTEAARIKGLSKREELPVNHGMLFDFKSLGDWRIWMVDMHFNIDIAWLNENGQVLHVKTNATPAEYPEIYHAGVLNRYVIELPAGSLDSLGIREGDIIDIN
jgi:uncharacterized protein